MSKKRFSGLRLILMVPVVVLLAGGLIIGGRALQEPGEVSGCSDRLQDFHH